MVKDIVERMVEKLREEAYRSSISGEPGYPRLAIRFKQGGRTFYTTAFSIAELKSLTKMDPSTKEDLRPEKKWNRPLVKDHVEAIAKYLTDPDTKNEYILPPITLDAVKQLKFIDCTEGLVKNGMAVGFLQIPVGYEFQVTDGQHRINALFEAMTQNQSLENDGFGVTIVQATSIEKAHQDFADCAKVKPIAASQRILFEQRIPVQLLAKDVCKRVPLLEKRVSMVSEIIGKNSSKVYTLNHVKIACEELLFGAVIGRDKKRIELSVETLAGDKKGKMLERIVHFFKIFSETNRQWKEVLTLDNSSKHATRLLRQMKDEFIIFNGTTLQVIGRVGHEILKGTQIMIEDNTRKLANLDWRRELENEDSTGKTVNRLWLLNILQPGGKVSNTRQSITIAAANVKHILRLPLTEAEEKALSEWQTSLHTEKPELEQITKT